MVVVGLYPHDTAASNAYILGHSDARLVLLDTEARWKSLWPFRSQFPSLERVWIHDAQGRSTTSPTGPIVRNSPMSSPPLLSRRRTTRQHRVTSRH